MALLSRGGMLLPWLRVCDCVCCANPYGKQQFHVWLEFKVRTPVLGEGRCSGSSKIWVRKTLAFGPSCAPRGEKNGNINQDCGVIKFSVQFIIAIHCEIKLN